ncbi:MAG: UDP-N-acetylmuramoyl-L-alanyl-D-glutamate--2,6-diaminopimelate ligase, partial [Paludibacteraceae bacterium]|nr:UDP-N-acetylmuramoyl-L-alanyl-D-glutamate--2,6-diaminopimelate ligase [Paludibacteraceae bacterium]
MKLEELRSSIEVEQVVGPMRQDIRQICFDSRQVAPGTLFVAVKGSSSDGHAYIGQAVEKGASAVVCQELPETCAPEVCYLKVANSAVCLGRLASCFYGNPSQKMKVVGVTGTNGKTTIATLLYRMFRRMGHEAGLLSTVCNYIGDEAVASTHTTPDPIEAQSLMARMVEKGCQWMFMEVSSHAIDQDRIAGIDFDGGIFTNLTRDHLDYHKTVDAYLKAKKKFFDQLPAKAFALTNDDDKTGRVMLQNTAAAKYGYSIRSLSDFRAKVRESSFEGMTLEIDGHEVLVHFVGKFNASNLIAVYGAARLLGVETEAALIALSALHTVDGRFDTVYSPQGVTAIVDYAHTPDALKNVLKSINEIRRGLPVKHRVITVAGFGGIRDKGKRPMMTR